MPLESRYRVAGTPDSSVAVVGQFWASRNRPGPVELSYSPIDGAGIKRILLIMTNAETTHEQAECCICGFTVTTHPDDSQGGLAFCGDCGKPTCAAHRDDSQAQRCHRCAGKLNQLDPLVLARTLYVKRATRPERDALSVKKSHAQNLIDKAARTRAKNCLPELRRRLALAERLEGEIFDAVVRGERAP